MSKKHVYKIATIAGYNIDGLLFTCDSCGASETIPAGVGENPLRIPHDWIYIYQYTRNKPNSFTENHYCNLCGKKIGIGI